MFAEQRTVGGLNKKGTKTGEPQSSREGKDQPFIPIDAESITDDSVEYGDALARLSRAFPKRPVGESDISKEATETELQQRGTWPGCQIVYRVACFIADGPGSEYPSEPAPTYK